MAKTVSAKLVVIPVQLEVSVTREWEDPSPIGLLFGNGMGVFDAGKRGVHAFCVEASEAASLQVLNKSVQVSAEIYDAVSSIIGSKRRLERHLPGQLEALRPTVPA